MYADLTKLTAEEKEILSVLLVQYRKVKEKFYGKIILEFYDGKFKYIELRERYNISEKSIYKITKGG